MQVIVSQSDSDSSFILLCVFTTWYVFTSLIKFCGKVFQKNLHLLLNVVRFNYRFHKFLAMSGILISKTSNQHKLIFWIYFIPFIKYKTWQLASKTNTIMLIWSSFHFYYTPSLKFWKKPPLEYRHILQDMHNLDKRFEKWLYCKIVCTFNLMM